MVSKVLLVVLATSHVAICGCCKSVQPTSTAKHGDLFAHISKTKLIDGEDNRIRLIALGAVVNGLAHETLENQEVLRKEIIQWCFIANKSADKNNRTESALVIAMLCESEYFDRTYFRKYLSKADADNAYLAIANLSPKALSDLSIQSTLRSLLDEADASPAVKRMIRFRLNQN
ncbi:MAG: hypothetical protein K2X32_08120 [Phycisphaerales bacterium]|nr:hypothetical protein [Phycisphaerales bacterium]